MVTETGHGAGEAVAARIERRWAILSIVIVGVLVGMATYIGIHQANPVTEFRHRNRQVHGNGGLADPAFIRAYHNHYRLRHDLPLRAIPD